MLIFGLIFAVLIGLFVEAVGIPIFLILYSYITLNFLVIKFVK